ncbi:hypothetical protein F5J12DRAFT_911477 [Pisolithus orientalis]|uniref:uncharacterized protein n=1 Tax=Pisolithus orientalis TaxID=936130 RepID=UPI0022248227|nr:uncharacterized protein F5J12DRAFT_911477 [Pisolithus orientalis]KAI6019985.1 hypothetical protein F5J12DRAFT_911477 [Pisolithus orientalis]
MSLFPWSRQTKAAKVISPTDTIVFIIGPSGSGKSRFFDILLQIAKSHISLHGGRKSPTTEVYAERCRFEGDERDIVLVDTPSFYTNTGGEEILKKWIDSNFTAFSKASGILYMHSVESNPDDADMRVSKHFEAFWRACPRNLGPSAGHIVPTIFSRAGLTAQDFGALMAQLRHQANVVGASMLRIVFDGAPVMARLIIQEFLNCLGRRKRPFGRRSKEFKEKRWLELGPPFLKDAKKAALDKITLKRLALESAPVGHPDRRSAVISLADAISEWYGKEGIKADLDEIICLRRIVLEVTPPQHREHFASLVSLANFLEERYRREHIPDDLMEIITLRRAALKLAPLGHPERRSSLVNLADYLGGRCQRESSTEDLSEAIIHQRAALELTPPGHPERLASLNCLINLLDKRFTEKDSMNDLTEMITLRRAALVLTPPWHPHYRLSLVRLASCLDQRYRMELAMEDLTEIINLQRAALELSSPWYPEHLASLVSLSDSLDERLQREHAMQGDTEIITHRRAVLELIPPRHPQRLVSIVKLVNFLDERFRKEDLVKDLTEIINLRRAALEVISPGHPDYSGFLLKLAKALGERFKKDGGIEDLAELIALRRAALKLTPPGDPERRTFLLNLANYLEERFRRDGCMEDLMELISLYRAVLELTSPKDPEHLPSLARLATYLDERFRGGSAMDDLREIIALRHAMLELMPPEDPEYLPSLAKLTRYLEEQFRMDGAAEDAMENLASQRVLLECAPSQQSDRRSALVGLADALSERFWDKREKVVLDVIITVVRGVLKSTPPEHPEHFASLIIAVNYLDQRYNKESAVKDLMEIITLRRAILEFTPSEKRLEALVNLANNLDERFRKEGAMEDLMEAIIHRRAALELIPPGHPEHLASLAGLANNLDERFRRKGAMEDLTEVITLRRAVVESTPSAERLVALVNLMNNLDERFRKEGAMEDLTEIIILQRAALKLIPQGHPRRRVCLTDLANNLDERFRRERAKEDLTEIITHRRAALELMPPGHPGRLAPLVALVDFLDKRFESESTLTDLEGRISLRRVILECTSPASPDRFMSLVNLATCLREKYQRLGVDADAELDEAIRLAQDAVALCPPEHRLSARACLANCIELKIKKRDSPVVTPNSDIKQMISNIVDETVIPLRLLNTETGALCDRDAQMLRFERSDLYSELLSSVSMLDDRKLEALVRKAVSKFFRYAMMSHRWGRGEPLLCNMRDTSIYYLPSGDGVVKLQSFCLLAFRQGFLWAWSDTCCIDKGSSAEVQEAIGSMFSWYRRAALTIVYLSDVPDRASFTNSVWFKRGWTLQELLASPSVLFYMPDWTLYMDSASSNHKADVSVLEKLRSATGIADGHLRNFRPGMDDARSRLQWASARRTTKPEDIAYSLFGIFDLHLPVLYGESAEKALGRLLAEIISQSGDVSVLDWVGQRSTFHSCFPATLRPYQTVPYMQSTPGNPAGRSDISMKRVWKLYRTIVKLPRPRFVNRRLALPCFRYPITAVKLLGPSYDSSRHEYEIYASDLKPLRVTISVDLQEGSGSHLPYTLIRPWDPKWLLPGAKDSAVWMLLERFEQPFHALLLKTLPHNEYTRIASDCKIIAHAQGSASIINNEPEVLEIV